MPLVSGAIPNLINGVSQQPPSLRLPTQGQTQENGLSSVVRGLEKRPGTQHISEIDTSFTDSTAFIHSIQRDEEEAYVAVLSDESIKVYDLVGKYIPYGLSSAQAGNEVPVYRDTSFNPLTSTQLNYLDVPSGSTAQETFGATTVADFTFLLNRSKTISKGTTYSHERPYEAYIYVKNGDYKSKYTVKITQGSHTHTVTVETPDGVIKSNTTGASGNTPETTQLNNQAAVSTQVIAKALATGSSGLSTTTNPDVITDLSISSNHLDEGSIESTLTGNWYTVHDASNGSNFIYLASSTDFSVTVSDGRGNEDIDVFVGHKQVSSFGKLPANLPPEAEKGYTDDASNPIASDDYNTTSLGFTIKVGGDNQKAQDDYYVYWNGDSWKETLLPRYASETADAYKTSFDASTMPHQLKKQFDSNNKVYFVMEQSPWVARTVGDNDTNPFPSFTDFEINDIFFHRNR